MEYIDAIRTARNIKKMSQTEAAEAIGVTQTTVSRWETGQTVPNALNLIKMGEVYGKSIDQLCGVKPL